MAQLHSRQSPPGWEVQNLLLAIQGPPVSKGLKKFYTAVSAVDSICSLPPLLELAPFYTCYSILDDGPMYIPYSICWDLYCDWTVSLPVGFPGLWWHQDSAVSHNTLMPPKPITSETLTYYHIWLSSLATILDTNVSQFLCDDFEESDGNYKYFLEK